MSYGRLSKSQYTALAPFVHGKTVHDIGAGDLTLAGYLLTLGASHIIAIDKNPWKSKATKNITVIETYFERYTDPLDVAFVSWPINHFDQGLLDLIGAARTVIYLGKNSDGQACGFPLLFDHLSKRENPVYIAERPNTLAIYGPNFVERPPNGEERASLSIDERMWSYDELEGPTTRITLPG